MIKTLVFCRNLLKYIRVTDVTNVISEDTAISGLSLVFTGKFNSMSRSEAKDQAERMGAKSIELRICAHRYTSYRGRPRI